ncbi:MAG TPA: TlpA disulfide reductase family protein [Pyrinomonadaceae bacterium]|jgi:peroxiredoxin
MTFKSRRPILAAAISILLLLPFYAPALPGKRQTGPVQFSFRSIDGPLVTSESLRGEVVVLAFGANWLPLSRKQVQGVRKLADDYGKRGVAVFWVSTDSESSKSKNFASDDQLRAFSKKHSLQVTVLRDPDGQVSKQFGIDQLPAIVILNKQGIAEGSPIGGLDPEGNLADQLAPTLDRILQEEE